MTTETYSVQTIRAYLLGQLPEAETEQLDELSITDDECAERIRAVEHDLVDAFARGELQGVVLEQFRSRYLTTPRRREATRFAQALQSLEENSGSDSPSEAGRGETTLVREKRRWPERLALAAAMILLAPASAWLALDNRTLRARVTGAESARDELQRGRQGREAEARRAADTAQSSANAGAAALTVATLVLTPQLRSVRQLPTVTLSGGTGDLAVQLDLEPVDYPAYDMSLVASTGDRVVWRTDRLAPRTVGARKVIDLRLPAAVLGPQDYLIRVSGVPARGASEIVGEYRFTVVK
jgi:anti-sigma factor RsiW